MLELLKKIHFSAASSTAIIAVILYAAAVIIMKEPVIPATLFAGLALFVFLCVEPKRLVYAQMFYCCIVGYLTTDLGFPSFISYMTDILNLAALLFAISSCVKHGRIPDWGLAPASLLLFVLVAALSALFHGVSPLLFFLACRNVLRLFVFSFSCSVLLDRNDISFIVRFLLLVLAINVFLCSLQSFVQHLHGDYVSGVFGRNAALNVHLLIVVLVSLFSYMENRINLLSAAVILIAASYIAALAELKFFFIELLFAVVVANILHRPSLRGVLVTLGSAALLVVFVAFLGKLYPAFAGFFSLERVFVYSGSGYTGGESLGRLTAISQIRDLFMHNRIDELFGLGFGSGQYTQYFSSPLYYSYGTVYRWSWFGDASIFLETGFVGLSLYAFIYVVAGFSIWGSRKTCGDGAWLQLAGATMALFCLPLLIYNTTLIVEPACYLVALFISLPVVQIRQDRSNRRAEHVEG